MESNYNFYKSNERETQQVWSETDPLHKISDLTLSQWGGAYFPIFQLHSCEQIFIFLFKGLGRGQSNGRSVFHNKSEMVNSFCY